MQPSLTHLALQVKDLDACVSFYREFCGLHVVHSRESSRTDDKVVWLAESGRETELVLVLIPGGTGRVQAPDDYSHLGFALGSVEAVSRVAEKGAQAGCLVWPVTEEPYPVGTYCGLSDPDGNTVEFSYGQPLGPGGGQK
jgi:catechol 2,3-dioxygenase-like lactoylglutathione lyase family enzyme